MAKLRTGHDHVELVVVGKPNPDGPVARAVKDLNRKSNCGLLRLFHLQNLIGRNILENLHRTRRPTDFDFIRHFRIR